MDYIKNAKKNSSFRIRINEENLRLLEKIYEKNGLSLTDAVNVFFQQSINAGGFPFPVNEENAADVRKKAMRRLTMELQEGINCKESCSEEEALSILGVRDDS